METVKSCLIEKTKLLKANLITTPKLEARLLLAKAINKDLNWTYLNLEKKISKKKLSKYEILIKKKLKKFPTAYLLGYKEFYSMNFKVNKNTLIPRPETEIIIEEIKKNFKNKKRLLILDLGTGSGCILLSILKEFKNAIGIGIDKYSETVKVARINSKRNNLSKRSKFFKLDWNHKDFFKQRSGVRLTYTPMILDSAIKAIQGISQMRFGRHATALLYQDIKQFEAYQNSPIQNVKYSTHSENFRVLKLMFLLKLQIYNREGKINKSINIFS